jgi:HD-like signal output (HDOD) protein
MTEAAPDILPVEEVRSRLLILGEISPPPAIAQELIRLVGNENTDIQDVVRVVEKSPEMAARVLRWANSAYYGQRHKIISVKDGIIRVLGVSTANSLLLALALASSFEVRKITFFPIERFWYLAVATATLGQELAQQHCKDKLSPGIVYTAGLIHNIGLLALATAFPEELKPIFFKQKGKSLNSLVFQKIGIDPCVAGAWLAKRWGLPDDLVRVIRHHKEHSYEGQQWELVRLVCLAAHASEYHLDGKALSDIPVEFRVEKLINLEALFSSVEYLNKRFDELKNFSQLLV